MDNSRAETDNARYSMPPEVYDIGVGWDPQPEISRLLFLAEQAGVRPGSALELGCGTGRLMRALREHVPDTCGIELSPAMADLGRARGAGEILVGDMSDFTFGRRFDLIFASANTIRHVLTADAIARMWDCIREHLEPGGLFIADLELGFAAEAAKVGRPATWMIAHGETTVHASWLVAEPPSPKTRCCTIAYTLEARGGALAGKWQERFRLRTYDAHEFLEFATVGGGLEPRGIYELRDPYLLETSAEKAVGRFLAVLRRADAD
ncbi:MAG: class I SAM-dependent methyltransferase [Phycisphaerae bacterium]